MVTKWIYSNNKSNVWLCVLSACVEVWAKAEVILVVQVNYRSHLTLFKHCIGTEWDRKLCSQERRSGRWLEDEYSLRNLHRQRGCSLQEKSRDTCTVFLIHYFSPKAHLSEYFSPLASRNGKYDSILSCIPKRLSMFLSQRFLFQALPLVSRVMIKAVFTG